MWHMGSYLFLIGYFKSQTDATMKAMLVYVVIV